jgi:hypothetical protein
VRWTWNIAISANRLFFLSSFFIPKLPPNTNNNIHQHSLSLSLSLSLPLLTYIHISDSFLCWRRIIIFIFLNLFQNAFHKSRWHSYVPSTGNSFRSSSLSFLSISSSFYIRYRFSTQIILISISIHCGTMPRN